eukprot:m.171691 g.171691  ORF g.171691 m.171691 type:complete len:729 (+) comp39070_c1_seq4:1248-3434(+)
MSSFSRVEVDFFRNQFKRFDSSNQNALDYSQCARAVDACWRIAGCPRQATSEEVYAMFTYYQQNERVTMSQFITLLQRLKTSLLSEGQGDGGGKWTNTLKKGGRSTMKKLGQFFGVTDQRVDGAPSNMQLWEYKTKERVAVTGLGPNFGRRPSQYRSDRIEMNEVVYDNRASVTTPKPDSEGSSEEYISDTEIKPQLPPKRQRQEPKQTRQNAGRAQVAGPSRGAATNDEFMRDPNEALVYYRRRVKEEAEAEEKHKKENAEWFGFDQSALMSSSQDVGKGKGKKENVDTFVRMQLESLPQFFPIFIILISVGQVIAMGLTAYFGRFAPIGLGVDKTNESFSSLLPPYTANFTHTVAKNMWIGPNGRYLIQVGAKFTPCMREDSKIYAAYARKYSEEGSSLEGGYGCCILERESYRAGAYTTSRQCTSDYKGAFQPAEKCSEYITRTGDNILIEFRPCCTTVTGDCRLTSSDLCEFYEGKYHADEESCREVNCLSDVCSMGGLSADVNNTYQPANPNQWWRFITPLVFHLGFIHLTLVVVFQLFVGWSIEKTAGWLRVFLIYFISGIGGYIISGIFIPYMPSAGGSPAAFGLLAVLVIELFQTWQIVQRKALELIKLTFIVVVFLMIGTLPYVDNFAHIGGFCFGLVAGVIFLPYITFGKWDARRKKILVIIAVPSLFIMFVVSLVIFYHVQNTQTFCPNCKYVNCIPYTSTICEDTLASPNPDDVEL